MLVMVSSYSSHWVLAKQLEYIYRKVPSSWCREFEFCQKLNAHWDHQNTAIAWSVATYHDWTRMSGLCSLRKAGEKPCWLKSITWLHTRLASFAVQYMVGRPMGEGLHFESRVHGSIAQDCSTGEESVTVCLQLNEPIVIRFFPRRRISLWTGKVAAIKMNIIIQCIITKNICYDRQCHQLTCLNFPGNCPLSAILSKCHSIENVCSFWYQVM